MLFLLCEQPQKNQAAFMMFYSEKKILFFLFARKKSAHIVIMPHKSLFIIIYPWNAEVSVFIFNCITYVSCVSHSVLYSSKLPLK